MSSTALKLLALLFMLADHIWEFIPGMPLWLHWLGRLAAPLFYFCAAWGACCSHDRGQRLWRLYVFGAGMALADFAANQLARGARCAVSNNIFVSLLLVGIGCALWELHRTEPKKARRYAGLFVLWQAAGTVLCLTAERVFPGQGMYTLLGGLMANIFFCEGGTVFVLLGMGLYLTRTKPRQLCLFYSAFSAAFFVLPLSVGTPLPQLLGEECQWMMLGALPLMLCYNGQKGAGLKYGFYVFYPAHIFVLFWLGNTLFR